MTLQELEKMQPDEKGMVVLELGGIDRKFIKDRLLSYLRRQPQNNLKQPAKPKENHHRKVPVIAILKDGTQKPFPSSADAARELNIDRTNIPHALSGKYKHVGGVKFQYA